MVWSLSVTVGCVETQNETQKLSKGAKWAIGIAVFAVLGLIGSIMRGTDDTSAADEPTPTPSMTAEEAADDQPIEDRFAIDELDGVVTVTFAIRDNFTKNMIASGAKQDTLDALRLVVEEYPDYSTIFIYGTFPIVDQYGNEDPEGEILFLTYQRATVDLINFDGIDPDNIWDIRDGGRIDPGLES